MGETKLTCETCQSSFVSELRLERHKKTKQHLEKLRAQGKKRFFCEVCRYGTDIKCNYKSHLSSKKHVLLMRASDYGEHRCALCDVVSRDKANFDRHVKTAKHLMAVDASLDMPREKLDMLILELASHMRTGCIPVVEEKLDGKRVITPKHVVSYHESGEKFLLWIKSVLEPIENRFSLENGELRFFWPTHRYILSKKDFVYFVLSLASKVLERKILDTEGELKRINESIGCDKHPSKPRKCCSFCIPETVMDMHGFDRQKYDANIKKRIWAVTEGTDVSRKIASAYCDWWFGEKNFREESRKKYRSIDIEKRGDISVICVAPMMDEITFIELLRSSICSFNGGDLGRIDVLVFLEKMGESLVPTMRAFSEKNPPSLDETNKLVYYSSFYARKTAVSHNIFASLFGFEKETVFSKRVCETVFEILKACKVQ